MMESLQPLDDLCRVIKLEINRVKMQRRKKAEEWIFSNSNQQNSDRNVSKLPSTL